MATQHADREAAVDQLCAITATDTTMGRRSIEQVLRSTDWNVEQAANLIFSNPDTLRQQQQQQNTESRSDTQRDRSAAMNGRPRSAKHRPRETSAGPGRPPVGARVGISPLLRALTWPIRFVLRLISGLWYLLVRNVLPLGFLPYMPRFLLPPSGPSSSSSGYSSSIPLPSRLPFVETLRQECPDGYMPDFWRQGGEEAEDEDENEQGGRVDGTYKEFLNHLKEERKVGCVVLCCSDHEDDLEFKRNVLTNEEFVRCLRENDILIWGADIREKEGYQVSQTLQATTYPAISFFSLMPVNSSSGSSSNSKFTILTTVQGPPSTTTSAPALIQLITNTIVPRTRPFLNRLRRERHALEEARRVRDEQDRRLAESERRDRDKILKIRRDNEERARREREEAERLEREQAIKQREKERRDRFHADMREWRRYARQHLLRAEPSAEDVKAKRAIRVQIRLPQGVAGRSLSSATGARNVRVFPVDLDTSRDVYIWAETLLLDAQEADGEAAGKAASLPAGFTTDYPPRRDEPFLKLFTAYPRKEVAVDTEGWKVVLDAGGSLIMELGQGERFGGGDTDEEDSEDNDDESD